MSTEDHEQDKGYYALIYDRQQMDKTNSKAVNGTPRFVVYPRSLGAWPWRARACIDRTATKMNEFPQDVAEVMITALEGVVSCT